LHNRYETCWSGPWAGTEAVWKPTPALRVFSSFNYHWADYYADAIWNLRPEFEQDKSFEQFADGNGLVAGIGAEFQFSEQWSVRLKGDWQSWNTDPGTDRIFFANGTVTESLLNEVNWTSYAVSVGVTLRLSTLVTEND